MAGEYDPFAAFQLAGLVAQNPAMAPQLDAMGIPPPPVGMEAPMGEMINTSAPGAAPGGMDAKMLMQLASLQGVKAPGAAQPIMHGGVVGGAKPPELGAKMGLGSAQGIGALIQALGHGAGGSVVPSLGQYILGRR